MESGSAGVESRFGADANALVSTGAGCPVSELAVHDAIAARQTQAKEVRMGRNVVA